MRTESALDLQTIDDFRPCPAFRRIKDDHRPTRPGEIAIGAGGVLDFFDFLDHGIERGGHFLVHFSGLVTFHKIGRPTVATEQLLQFLASNAREHGWVGNFVTVQMQNRQHRPIRGRVEEFIGMPGRRQRACFGFAIADNASDNKVRVVKHSAERMAERIAEFAAFVH